MNKKYKEHSEIIQSYLSVTAAYSSDVYVERIFTIILMKLQNRLKGTKVLTKKERILFDNDEEIEIDISDLFENKKSTNSTFIKNVINEGMKKIYEFKSFDNDDNETIEIFPFINAITIYNRTSITFTVSKHFLNNLFDFRKGFRAYEYIYVFRLSSSYSIRIYKLLSHQSKPIEISIDEFRRRYGLDAKSYKDIYNIKRLLSRVQTELIKKGIPYIFDFEIDGKKNKIILYPMLNSNYDWDPKTNPLIKKNSNMKTIIHCVKSHVYESLRNAGLTRNHLAPNMNKLLAFSAYPEADTAIDEIIKRSKIYKEKIDNEYKKIKKDTECNLQNVILSQLDEWLEKRKQNIIY